MARRRRRGSQTNLLLWALSTGIFIVGGAAIALGTKFYFDSVGEFALLDEATYCPKTGPTSTTVVLIDRTDGLNEKQAEALQRQLMVWAGNVPKHGLMEIYEVGRGETLLAPVVSVCNPGDGEDQSKVNSSPAKWRERYEDKFTEPIRRMAEEMRGESEAPVSPILEGVQAIAIRDFGPDAPKGPMTLYLVSDLLQHGPEFSLYHSPPDSQAFQRSAYGRSVLTQLQGVHVWIHWLNRQSAAGKQTDDLINFWYRILQGQGAVIEGIAKLPG